MHVEDFLLGCTQMSPVLVFAEKDAHRKRLLKDEI